MRHGPRLHHAIRTAGHWTMAIVFALQGILALYLPWGADAVTQNAYRWRNDDGTEAAATFAAAENASFGGIPKNIGKRVRFGVANSGSESELVNKATASMQAGADFFRTGVIDTAAGFAYFGLQTIPGQIIKVRLSDFTIVATLVLNTGENTINAAVIDTAAGFAYFGTGEVPGIVVKISLSTFTRVGAITMNAGEGPFRRNGVIDPSAGFAYFTTQTSPAQIVKISLSTFTRVGAITLASGENSAEVSVIDTTGATHYMYLATLTSPGKIVKIDLSAFSAVSTLTLNSGENSPAAAVIDTAAGFAYFGTGTSPGIIVKIALSTFTRVGAITLNSGENSLFSEAAIDTAAGFAYFGTFTAPAIVIKVNLSTFARDSAVTFSTNENNAWQLLIDVGGGNLYAGTYSSAGYVKKISLASFTVAATLSPQGGVTSLTAVAFDSANGVAYYGTRTVPGKIVKVRLSDLAVLDTLHLPVGDDRFRAAVIDPSAGFAYFGTETVPAKVVKINLATFTKVSTLTLPSGEDNIRTAVIDPSAGFAYFGMNTSSGKVAKIDLSTFTEVGGAALTLSVGGAGAAVIDTTGATHYMYVGTQQSPGRVAKIDLSTFTEVGTPVSISTGSFIGSAAIDTVNGFAYFGTGNNPGRIIKVNLSTFTETTPAITLASGEGFIDAAAIDTVNGFGYFGTDVGGTASNYVIKVDLATFTKVATLTYALFEMTAPTLFVDQAGGNGYIGTFQAPGKIFKFSIAPKAQFRIEYGQKSTTCGAIVSWTQVPATPASSQHWQMSNSTNIADGATTTDLSGLGNGNITFQAGRVHDQTSQTAQISLGEKQFTELEYSIRPTGFAVDGANYCFRLTDAGSPSAFTYSQYAEASVTASASSTQANRIVLGRIKTGVSTTADVHFSVQNAMSGILTVTFPAGFTVTAAATGGSACLSGFGFTSSTLTATKIDCSGTISMTGATVTNPGAPGIYFVGWVNDDPGLTAVIITSSDQSVITASIEPTFTFNAGAQASATACDGTFSGAGGTVPFGVLSTTSVSSSDAASIPHICTRLTTDATAGAAVAVRSVNASLKSTAAPADTIPSATVGLVAGTAGYGLCVGSAGADSGKTDPSGGPASSTPTRSSPFNGTCTAAAHNIGALTTSFQTVWSTGAPSLNAFARIYLKAAIATGTPAHNDYADTLTFTATGTY